MSPAYPVYVEGSLQGWEEARSYTQKAKQSRYFLITEKGLPPSIVEQFVATMSEDFPMGTLDPHILWLEGGEKNKNFSQLETIYDRLIALGIDRDSCILALGGGVVGDFSGFVAASILRGINYIQIPTTLLAAVDASVGGKVGVNTKLGKNMVGAFHHPCLVYCNTLFLYSLALKEWRCGLAEMLKHGLIESSGQVLNHLEQRAASLRTPKSTELRQTIIDSIQVKANIVQKDEKESGQRALLNLGHTTAHALESLGSYQRFSHGEAVSRGLVTALLLSCHLNHLDTTYMQRIINLMQKLELPQDTAGYSAKEVYEHMRYDKKNKGKSSQVYFVLLKQPGQAIFGQPVSYQDFQHAWTEQSKIFT